MHSKVSVEFSIIGNTFDPNIITDTILVNPTGFYLKGEIIRGIEKKETCWFLSTGYEETLDVKEQFKKILRVIKDKTNDFNQLKSQYNLDYKFFIVIGIEQNQTPAIYLDNEIIEFANGIKAEIDFDLYIY
ncbi:DUF4279 domain-containing protein [Paenibacillus alkaliterrae]